MEIWLNIAMIDTLISTKALRIIKYCCDFAAYEYCFL